MTPEFALRHLPQDAIDNYPYFAEFMQLYYNWNITDGFGKILNNYKDLVYQNLTNTDYESLMLKSIGVDVNITEQSSFHNEILYKLANEFLESRGTKVSLGMLFKMVYNKKVDVKFPRDNLFIPSNATYQRTNTILVDGLYPMTIYSSLTGLRSGTTTGIESFIPYYINGNRYYLVECINIHDSFTIGEPIKVQTIDGISYTILHYPLISLNIKSGGSGYKIGDTINPSSNIFSGHFIVSNTSKGSIDSITIENGGSGYIIGDKVTTVEDNHFYAYVDGVDSKGSITSIKITNGGYNMRYIPSYIINTSNGNGASITLHSTTIGSVTAIKPSDGSIIYDTANISYTTSTSNGSGLDVSSMAVPHYRTERYINNQGFLGYRCDILDSYTKHSHSYDIISEVPSSKYSSNVEKYNNPTGYVFNKKYKTTNKISVSNAGIIHYEVTKK